MVVGVPPTTHSPPFVLKTKTATLFFAIDHALHRRHHRRGMHSIDRKKNSPSVASHDETHEQVREFKS